MFADCPDEFQTDNACQVVVSLVRTIFYDGTVPIVVVKNIRAEEQAKQHSSFRSYNTVSLYIQQ